MKQTLRSQRLYGEPMPRTESGANTAHVSYLRNFSPWTYLQLILLGSSIVILYGHTLVELGRDWLNNTDFSHGFFIPPVALFMIWRKREELLRFDVKPSDWGLLVIALGLLLHIVGNLAAELFTMRFAVIVTVFGLALYLLGWEISRKIFIPIAYLIFMIPIPAVLWNELAFPLQLLASKASAWVIPLAGIPILREGNVLHLANTSLEVVDACSGLRSLSSLLALSGLAACMCSLRPGLKWLVFLSAIPIAIVANVLRLTITAILAHWLGAWVAQGLAHEAGGLFVFLTAILLLLSIYGVIARLDQALLARRDKSPK